MKKILTLTLTLFTIALTNAQWGKKIKGNGNVVTIERSTGEYDAIAVSGWFDVILVEGKEGRISIEGEENLLEHIKTEVKEGKLVIKVKKGYNLQPSSWKKDGGIYVTVPIESVDAVSLSGSGDILGKKTISATNFSTRMSGSGDITLDVESKTVKASMSGSGDINLSGTTELFDVQISGSGDVKAYDLIADTVDASISGSADIRVTAKEMLKARVSGSGDIHYRGDPKKIDSKTSGSGDVTEG
ncbi:head GIN domain-containing protein [uncultured Eudoraea sp.]|uniref:head GIN domain-containing protein n=1 Tax=uncultured Eudoraea sp. TaxID=1035614 RepID=UPI0026178C7B|nr:head GIN domain-containing protein [uncultured Eudoraea sp.]